MNSIHKSSLFFLICALFSIMSKAQSIAIKGGQLIDVENQKIIENSLVLIKDGIIKDVGQVGSIKIPEEAEIMDATGKWLSPGLIDAHIHLFQSGGLYTRPDAIDLRQFYAYQRDQRWIKENADDLLKSYLACGITTVVDVGGPFHNFALRDSMNTKTESPHIFLTGPLISTYQPEELLTKDPPIIKVNSIEEAKDLVRKQVPFKPDLIKIWYIVLPGETPEGNLPIVQAVIDESHANNIKVAVHATEMKTARLAIENGADILVHSVDDKVVDQAFIDLLKEKGTIYVPTLIVHQKYAQVFGQNYQANEADFNKTHPHPLGTLLDLQHIRAKLLVDMYKAYAIQGKVRDEMRDSVKAANLQLLAKNNIPIATGTDAGNIGTLHGSSYFDELAAMAKAGLSNWELIQASTINAAQSLNQMSHLGSINKGKSADVLLLNANPLEDIQHLQQLDILVHKGQIIDLTKMNNNSPENLAQRQLNAYNLRDIDAFLEPYSDEVEIYNFPDELLYSGKEKMRTDYAKFFKETPNLHCKLVNRMVLGNKVIDQEEVTGFPNDYVLEAVAIYYIENEKITKVYFMRP